MRYGICLLIHVHSCVGQITIFLLIVQLFTKQKKFWRCLTSYNLTLIPKCHTIFLCGTTHNLSEGLETHYIQHLTIFHRGWYLTIDLIQSQKTTISCWAKCGWYSTIFFFSISFLEELEREGIENFHPTFYFDVLYGRRSWIRTKRIRGQTCQISLSNWNF